MRDIPLGTTGQASLIVRQEHLASQIKSALLPPVLATPIMILVMENAALDAIRPFLDSGESAIGTLVDVRHLAATPVGQQVTAEASSPPKYRSPRRLRRDRP